MSEPSIRLSLLDFNWVGPGQSPIQSLRETFAIAKRADALGYSRLWLGEHHYEAHATGSPQLLAGILAASTRGIRVGVGAILLQYWSPLKIAEDFRLLEAVFGRIDLGVGRGRADNVSSHRALLDGRPGSDAMMGQREYEGKVEELLGFIRDVIPPEHPHAGAAVTPHLDIAPEVWICGSETAAPLAARTGSKFCCTLFHGRMVPPSHVAQYRTTFMPSKGLQQPHAAIALCGVCAETEEEAQAIGRNFPLRNYLPTVVGTPEICKAKIEGFCREYGTDEVMFLDIALTGSERMRSLELMAKAFDLRPRG